MAANDILLKREETISYYDDKMLNPYREFERYVGTFQEFQDQFEPVWYSNYEPYAITNTGYPDGDTDGEGVFKYQLGTSSAITPLRNKLIPSKDYIKEKKLYYLSIIQPGVLPHSFQIPDTDDGTAINFKIKIYFGWNGGYTYSGSSYHNPFMGSINSLSSLSTALSQMNPFTAGSSFSFAQAYMRYSKNGQSNLQYWDGSSGGNPTTNWGWRFNCCQDGIKKILQISAYKGDWITTRNTSVTNGSGTSTISGDTMHFFIPGNYHDTTDPNTYWIYGVCATSHELASGSYFDLSGYNHTTKLMLNYLGDDNDFYNSSGQSTNSKSGFLNFSSGAQDRKDKLRYIYTFYKLCDCGYTSDSYISDALILWGIHNNIHKIRIHVHFTITPFAWNYLRTDNLSVILKYNGNTITIDLLAKMTSTTSSGEADIIVDDRGTTKSGNGTEGTYWTASASPSSINWLATGTEQLEITYCTLDGSNKLGGISPKTINITPSGTKRYCCVNLNFQYGSEYSYSSEVKFKITTFNMQMKD